MAKSNYYVDPAGGNDTTGDGTSGTPWATVQKALNTITRNSADGDQINVKAGGTDTLGATLSLSTYGTPDQTGQLYIRGYTSSANDGGIGEINGGGSYVIYDYSANSNKSFINFLDMKLGNCGTAKILNIYSATTVINCELHTSSANPALYVASSENAIMYCYIHDLTGATNIDLRSTGVRFLYNYILSASGTTVLYSYTGSKTIIGNIFNLATDTSLRAIYAEGGYPVIAHNTIYCSSANTSPAIDIDSNNAIVFGNVIEGFSGSGGKGLVLDYYGANPSNIIYGVNAYYNCATNESGTPESTYSLGAAISLAASPFVNAGSGDFNITTGSLALGASWPAAYKNLASTVGAADIGAVQNGAGPADTLEARAGIK